MTQAGGDFQSLLSDALERIDRAREELEEAALEAEEAAVIAAGCQEGDRRTVQAYTRLVKKRLLPLEGVPEEMRERVALDAAKGGGR